MKYIVAVSGGVDSVVLLDMWSKERPSDELIVAHFDHGIRAESAADARFVKMLAKRYGYEFVSERVELGAEASEATARQQRYQFLRRVAAEQEATIVTAHHRDDVLGSMVINIQRGTGWRGLAPFGASDVERPLLKRTKKELYYYASQHRLEYVEDSTNQDPRYLRNKLRPALAQLSPVKVGKLQALYRKQTVLRKTIESLLGQILDESLLSRAQLRVLDDKVASELLRVYITRHSGVAVTWPAVERALMAAREGQNGNEYQLGDKVSIWLRRNDIVVGHTRPVL